MLAADGLGSTLRAQLSDDQPISSGYVAYRGAVPVGDIPDTSDVALRDVVFYVGPYCHLVRYPPRRGELFNQVAVFRSPRALAGEADWGTPDELGAAFARACPQVRAALPNLWRNRWWRMYDREPLPNWVNRRMALTGAAHPMPRYLAQGACQALEDADCLADVVTKYSGQRTARGGGAVGADVDWDTALRVYTELRTSRTGEVQRKARDWGEFWHRDGLFRSVRNAMMRDRDPRDYRYVDWLYGT